MQSKVDVQIHQSWKPVLEQEFNSDSFFQLRDFLKQEKQRNVRFFPPGGRIFAAFDSTPWDAVKVVIIGQDPYHGAGQANGLCFSVAPGIRKPPSLDNIFKELHDDLGHPVPDHGDLSTWADQGVLLLNAILTVQAHKAGSHQGKGWETFTDAVIRKISDEKEGVVFILWGKFAQGKETLIDTRKHFVIKSAHPSPYSAAGGFFGSRPFSQANRMLEKAGKDPVDWKIE